ncbi:MAG: AI-2E family transporter [Jatrophihabitans sp.]
MDETDETEGAPPGPPLSRQTPFYRGFFGALGVLAAVVLAVAVRDAASVLVLILIAAFLATGLEPVVGWLGRRGVRRGWAVAGIGVSILAFVGTIGYVLGSVLSDQISNFIDNAPSLFDDLRRNRTVAKIDSKYHIFSTLENQITDPNLAHHLFGGALGFGIGLFTVIANTIVVFVLTVYFLAAAPAIKKRLYLLAPASRRERVSMLGDEILHRVGRYAIGAVGVALLAGTVTAILCVSVGIGQYALPLAALVALLDLVPLVGAILGATSVCLVGLATSLPVGITCVIFYVIYEALEGYVIYPRVMRSSVDVPEYITIIAVLIGGAVGGIVGALLALPVAAAMILLLREVWVRRQDVV